MSDGPPRSSRDLATLFGRRGFFQTCRWRCGWQCFGDTVNPSNNESFSGVLGEAISRRGLLRGALASAVMLVISDLPVAAGVPASVREPDTLLLGFQPIATSTEDRIVVPDGYAHNVIIRWGDPVLPGAPAFDVRQQSPQAQARQFGYNADFVAFFPLPAGHRASDHGLLAVNHEYTNPELMFPDYQEGKPTRAQVDIELASHGFSVVEVRRSADGSWAYVPGSPRNFRATGSSEMLLTGPAARHPLLRTSRDPSGTRVAGTLNNCGGGKTPWGTVLTAEENFNQYFANLNRLPRGDRTTLWHTRYGLTAAASERGWEQYHDRFDLSKEPNEPFRFGWVVEFDPYDPTFLPRKRTALGRMKHEAGTVVVARDGRVAVYTGDDERFEYAYKFVSARPMRRVDRAQNRTLLDEGTLYVARFNPDGTGVWLPLVFGHGPLVSAHGFENQGDVLINPRVAADLLGATKMDRPEDIEADPVGGGVYMVMTNNTRRLPAQVDAANPRPNNRHGHIIEVMEEGRDPLATSFRWQIFMLCGDPKSAEDRAYFAGFPADRVSAISSPDNIVFDRRGNMWIATDGQPGTLRRNDGVFMTPTGGPLRGYLRQFLSAPRAAEVCGPEFTPDNRTLFVAIQHPGEGGTLAKPMSTWPDGQPVPRPAVVAAWHRERQVIGA